MVLALHQILRFNFKETRKDICFENNKTSYLIELLKIQENSNKISVKALLRKSVKKYEYQLRQVSIYYILTMGNMMGVTSRTGTDYPSKAHAFTPGIWFRFLLELNSA